MSRRQSTTQRRDLTWSHKSGHPKYNDVADTKEVDDTKQSKQTEWKGQNSHWRDEQRKRSLKGDEKELLPSKAKEILG